MHRPRCPVWSSWRSRSAFSNSRTPLPLRSPSSANGRALSRKPRPSHGSSNEVGQERRGASVPIGLDRAIGSLSGEFRDDARSDFLGGHLRIVHATAGAVAGKAVTHMDILLEMVLQR